MKSYRYYVGINKSEGYGETIIAMLYGLETVAMTLRLEAELEVAELKMRFSLGVTRMGRIRNEHNYEGDSIIGGTVQ